MRIDLPKAALVGAQEPQQAAAVSNRSLPRGDAGAHPESYGPPPLVVGQEVNVVIVDELSGGRLLLGIGEVFVEADNPGGLNPGATLRVRVEQIHPQMVLHIVAQEPDVEFEAARLLRVYLPRVALGESLETLKRRLIAQSGSMASDSSLPTLNKLHAFLSQLLASNQPLTQERLMAFVRDGGLQYEAKLFRAAAANPESLSQVADNDLKGLLLGALKELETATVASEFWNSLTAQLSSIEVQQAVNLLAELHGDAYQLHLPFFFGSELSTVALAIEGDGKGSADDAEKQQRGCSLLFLLDLENFGRVRIDAHVGAHGLKVIFYIDQESSLVLLQNELPAFRETLQSLGYREVLLAAKPLSEIPKEKEQKFDALALGIPPTVNLLNVKA